MLTGNEAVALLVELHELEDRLATLKRRGSGPVPTRIQSVRTQLPEQVLHHHDRMRARGKKSVAPIRHWVCSGCFITVPFGERSAIQSGKDLYLCQTCGRFAYLDVAEIEVLNSAAEHLPLGRGASGRTLSGKSLSEKNPSSRSRLAIQPDPVPSSLDLPTPPKKRKPMKVARLVH